MTTTLRPTEPLQRAADGTRSRRYQVCVNSRPVGGIHLAAPTGSGGDTARILDLRIEEPDRRRGRGTVALLAAEEVARGWGCRRIGATVPAEAEAALRAATALGYLVGLRLRGKALGGTPPGLPAGSRGRPMTPEESAHWRERQKEIHDPHRISCGLPETEVRTGAVEDHDATALPDDVATAATAATTDTVLSVLEHEGTRVGALWLGGRDDQAWIHAVETDEGHRGQGHGRSLMLLAEGQAVAAGRTRIRLNVCTGNTPAERLCASLGYRTLAHHVHKDLL